MGNGRTPDTPAKRLEISLTTSHNAIKNLNKTSSCTTPKISFMLYHFSLHSLNKRTFMNHNNYFICLTLCVRPPCLPLAVRAPSLGRGHPAARKAEEQKPT